MCVPYAMCLPVSLWRRMLSWDSFLVIAYVSNKKIWLKASVLYEQLLSSVPYATLCPICNSVFMFFVYWTIHQLLCSKIDFFFKFNKFQPQKLFFRDFSHPTEINQLRLKFRHVCQLRTKVQFYRNVDMKSSLQFKAFSLDTEVIEWE